MSYFAVIREAGPTWTAGQGIAGQPAVGDHSAFMDELATRGSVLSGAPLAGPAHGHLRGRRGVVGLLRRAAGFHHLARRGSQIPHVRALPRGPRDDSNGPHPPRVRGSTSRGALPVLASQGRGAGRQASFLTGSDHPPAP